MSSPHLTLTILTLSCAMALAQTPAVPVQPKRPMAKPTKAVPIQPMPSTTQAAKPGKKADPTLLIGKPPPPLVVAKWVKGEPITKLEKGKVWVVDFWATWCGPCKAAIPHLTKLVQEHAGKVEVIGVSISERQKSPEDIAYQELVRKFVDKQGERMDYRVALDTPDKQMHATWFKPTGTGGIPTAYIIDQLGLVAWTGIGDPTTLERIVEEVLAGTFDPKREIELQQKLEAEAKERAAADIAKARANRVGTDEKVPGYREAMQRGDSSAALAALDAALAADAKLEASGPYQWKFMLLMQRNKGEEVNDYVRDLLKRYPTNDDVLGFASACIVGTSEDTPRFDKDLALQTAKTAAAMAKDGSRWQQFARWRYGWALWHTGEKEKAQAQLQLALDGVNSLKEKFDFGNLAFDCEDALKLFRR